MWRNARLHLSAVYFVLVNAGVKYDTLLQYELIPPLKSNSVYSEVAVRSINICLMIVKYDIEVGSIIFFMLSIYLE